MFVGAVEQMLRGWVVADAADVVKAFEHAAMDGGRGFAVKLLIDDRFGERFKRRLCTRDPQSEGAGAFDEFA